MNAGLNLITISAFSRRLFASFTTTSLWDDCETVAKLLEAARHMTQMVTEAALLTHKPAQPYFRPL